MNDTDACKFTKELKVGYWLVLDKADPVVHRVITSIKSDYELTVDADFTLSSATATDTLTHSNTVLGARERVDVGRVPAPHRQARHRHGHDRDARGSDD